MTLRLEQANVALAAQDLATLQVASRAALQEPTTDPQLALRAQALHATALVYDGSHAQALRVVQQVRQGLTAIANARLAAELEGHLAMVFNVCGRTRDCVQALQRQLQHAHAAGDPEQEATALASMASQHHNLGDCEEALNTAQQAAALYRRLGSAGNAFANNLNLSQALLSLNQYGAARAVLDDAVGYCQREAASTELRQIVAEARAHLWLRLGNPKAALQELASAPAPTAPRRRIQHLLLQAQAAQLQDDAETAGRCWAAVQPLLVGAGDTLMILSARAVASAALPAAAALQQLQAVLQAATHAEFAAARAHALMARARLNVKLGQPAAALQDAQQLWALRKPARHLLLDEGLLCAAVCEVADACGDAPWAQQVRQQAQQLFVQAALPHVPAAELDGWRAHALRRSLWVDVAR